MINNIIWDLMTKSLPGGYLKHLSVTADDQSTAYCQGNKHTETPFPDWKTAQRKRACCAGYDLDLGSDP